MPGFPFPGRPGGEHDEPLLDMIIARRALPPGAPPEMHDLARMLAALAGPGEPGELAGEVAARAAFIQVTSPAGSSPGRRPVRHRKSRAAGRLTSSRTGMAVALTAAAAGIAVLAAYANVLPGPVQQLAHIAVAAPSRGPASPPPSSPAGGSLAGTGAAVRPSHSAAPAHQSTGTAIPSAHSRPAASAGGHTAAPDQPPRGSGTVPGCPVSPGNSQTRGPVATPTSSAYWWQSALCSGRPAVSARPAARPSLAVPSIPRP